MYLNFKMKEATNKEEAIISILDVIKENPLWLNKCTSSLAICMKYWSNQFRKSVLQKSPKNVVIQLFVEFKTEYYNFKDNTVWS